MKWITCQVEDEIAEKFEMLCKALKISKSSLLRMLVVEKLAETSLLDDKTEEIVRAFKKKRK
jgi:hypothetical protein